MPADILYIDDEPDALIAAARTARARGRFVEFEPPDGMIGSAEAAAIANLWVFDFFNDDEERLKPSLDGVRSNGLSVFQQLRLMVGDARPPAVVVSNHLQEALGIDVRLERRHIVAEEVGVEWVAPKDLAEGVVGELLALADATEALRAVFGELGTAAASGYAAQLASLALKLPKNLAWIGGAVNETAAWRPPAWTDDVPDRRAQPLREQLPGIAELAFARAIVTWLLRQVLPYPSFLIRDRHVAVRLGISLKCLRDAIASKRPLFRRLTPILYRGCLAEFDGPRWWSAGVDALAWGLPRESDARVEALRALVAPTKFELLEFVDPVVVSDADLVETDEIAPAAQCVRADDDHFPSHAAPAWVKIEAAKHDKVLARRVKSADQLDLETGP